MEPHRDPAIELYADGLVALLEQVFDESFDECILNSDLSWFCQQLRSIWTSWLAASSPPMSSARNRIACVQGSRLLSAVTELA